MPELERQYNFSFIPNRVGDLRLEFPFFNRSTHEVLACRSMTASCTIDYENLEPLLRYGIHPLPTISDGNMKRRSVWKCEYNGSFRGSRSTENALTPYSYCIEPCWDSNEGDYGELSQDIYAATPGVVVISFNVKDTFESTSEDAKNITKQVLLNDKGEKYDWWGDEWIKKEVPKVKSGWMHVDIPVYLCAGDNKLRRINELVKVDEGVRVRR
jgi:hypothetical protein